MKYLLYTALRWAAGLSLVSVLILSCPAEVLSCHIEYSDWLINVFKKQGLTLNKRIGNYSSYAECQAAMSLAVEQSGDPNLAYNMSCVGCSDPEPAPQSQTVSPPATSANPSSGGDYQNTQDQEAREKERQATFEREKQALLTMLGAKGGASSGLKLKTPGNSGSGLALKPGTSSPLHPHTSTQPDDTAEKVREAREKTIKLKREVAGIQTLLRQCTKSLTNNTSEFDKWGDTVDKAYNSVLKSSPEFFMGLFLKYGLFKGLKELRKDSFDKLGKYLNSPDSKIQEWLQKELGGRSVDAEKLKQLVDLGQAEGDFATLIETEDEIRQNLDAVILVCDLLDIVGKGVPGGESFQYARVIGETYADLTSISYSWFSINRLQQDRAKLTVEVDSLSFRMDQCMKEIDCLEVCVSEYTDRCMERCTGKTRLHSPPPLLR